jgi:hypothetical protein
MQQNTHKHAARKQHKKEDVWGEGIVTGENFLSRIQSGRPRSTSLGFG